MLILIFSNEIILRRIIYHCKLYLAPALLILYISELLWGIISH